LVFLDTSDLLSGFAAYRTKGYELPYCMTDLQAKRYTFEKCVYEAYTAFRGVGGKRPDEGRGNWAQKHLSMKMTPAIWQALRPSIMTTIRELPPFG
jgi:hypothetical protein